MQKDLPCEERQKLEQAVVLAVQALCSAKKEGLAAARKTEREALQALREHIEQHDCQDQRTVH
jgi:hypothetical protein